MEIEELIVGQVDPAYVSDLLVTHILIDLTAIDLFRGYELIVAQIEAFSIIL